jgi:hypothetical protein
LSAWVCAWAEIAIHITMAAMERRRFIHSPQNMDAFRVARFSVGYFLAEVRETAYDRDSANASPMKPSRTLKPTKEILRAVGFPWCTFVSLVVQAFPHQE